MPSLRDQFGLSIGLNLCVHYYQGNADGVTAKAANNFVSNPAFAFSIYALNTFKFTISELELQVPLTTIITIFCGKVDVIFMYKSSKFNPLVPELFGCARKKLIVDRGIEYYRFIF